MLSSTNTIDEDILTIIKSDAIHVKDLNVWYKKNHALKNVNINIKEKSITAFIGPSGCGKTTLLRCFNRMNDGIEGFKLEGSILINNKDIYNINKLIELIEIRRKIGMVFQQPNLFPMSITRNMKLPVKENFMSLSDKDINRIIEKKLKDVHIYEEVKNRLNKSALYLSGGQQQRLCIARTIAIDPQIILFDEPCSALDPISTMKIEDLLMDLKEKYTIVIVTHNLEQAKRIADYVAFFYNGMIVEQGACEDIFINPKEEMTIKYLSGKF
ncbi:phosphate ABC transporter ATP-binding protein PstB [Pseudobacteroides cellulosolvens]|uniref:Phosphate ABC transporter, ATPase subunit n=1 Tax=Pseudobacteroides cellulosolvens ATCC 35603 = DSM 2933 TaxID=398512 RepID=A0A0L6JPF2_9FIRM|nr:phosphate ABC transporter ATP-binding protein PstB [Pseudobacteroides cellulosolvens]KNY27668.1 phosphate ABC transporter, ATPase subunit [Pseudobacteroides cellulosolvens ATCC 35603 = DSM 2933]